MNIASKEHVQEQAHLSQVIEEIKRQLDANHTIVDERRDHIIDTRKMIWEEMRQDNANWAYKLEAAGDVVMNSLELARIERGYLSAQAAMRKLQLLQISPYFGRIDFIEDGADPSETQQIYIGLSSLLDDDTLEPIIYDWRSPIASMYYDYTLGSAKYDTLDGQVKGQLLLKRQFRIIDGMIHLMFDSGIRIGDDMLQLMLGRSPDEKMKSIVTTIQSEQNKVIRSEQNPVLVVQGAAGSGKTSIALQRVAYLLYKYRKSIQADQMILFSPNPLFSDYISNVLPELGEDNMRQTTFQDFAEHRLGHFIQPEDRFIQMEEMLTKHEESKRWARDAGVAYKVSQHFLAVIQNYVRLLETEGLCFEPVPYGAQQWKKEAQLQQLFYEKFSHHKLHVRMERINELLSEELPELEKRQSQKLHRKMLKHPKYLGTEKELEQISAHYVRKKITAIKTFIHKHRYVNPIKTYRQLFADKQLFDQASKGIPTPAETDWEAIRSYTISRIDEGIVPCEDVPALIYLLESITGWNSFNSIRHVILDEAQDYSPFQHEIIRRLFPRSKLTLLGDLNQAIQPSMRIDSYDFIEDLYGKEQTGIMRLTKSYRSTTEIVEFTRSLLPERESVEAFSRGGDKPELIQMPSAADEKAAQMVRVIQEIRSKSHSTLAVICKTAAESTEAYQSLLKAGSPDELHLVTREDIRLTSALIVVPAYLAKGLEFDSVIIWDASNSIYNREEERKLFYTACTRAMNRLLICYSSSPTRFMDGVESLLYNKTTRI